MKTSIEWTDATWNPVTGCTKVSPGCKNCYAEAIAKRFWGIRKFHDVQCHPERLRDPLRWKKPRMVFVNSMSDLFHKRVSFDFVDLVMETMCHAKRHTYQVLTKRPELAMKYFQLLAKNGFIPPNVWLGVSVENQETYRHRVIALALTPAAVRFVSFEPLLEDIGDLMLDGVCAGAFHWAIIGGESGPKARPFNIDWARNIIRQCKEQSVPVFMKQVGSSPDVWDTTTTRQGENVRIRTKRAKLKDRKGGDPSEWPFDLRIREYPKF